MTTLPVVPLTFGDDLPARRVSMPPTHLADLDLTARRALLTQAGEPGFRAAQLSHHYFGRLIRDPGAMTDVPALDRVKLSELLLPRRLNPVRELACDDEMTR